jgi:hypothetical protein
MTDLFERKRTNPALPHRPRHSQHSGQRDSSHGDPIRNAGHFIRGSQLIGHQLAILPFARLKRVGLVAP